ncbi:MAG: twin-arginine translocase TatA/TatE family subunit, partial [Deltaproteobacteria bacterium]|nr:twin-arginine translocase TatA/TatE family subunit [Deltaproteobacteria bacterium]
MFGLGAGELLVIALVVLLLFGATRLPALLGGLGKGLREFKEGFKGEDEGPNQQPTAPAQPAP